MPVGRSSRRGQLTQLVLFVQNVEGRQRSQHVEHLFPVRGSIGERVALEIERVQAVQLLEGLELLCRRDAVACSRSKFDLGSVERAAMAAAGKRGGSRSPAWQYRRRYTITFRGHLSNGLFDGRPGALIKIRKLCSKQSTI